jgi:hypothetical protein
MGIHELRMVKSCRILEVNVVEARPMELGMSRIAPSS